MKKIQWKKAGYHGEVIAEINGQIYQVEKYLDHNERHKGEWNVKAWDWKSMEWIWDNTLYGKANAKAWAEEIAMTR